MLECFKSQKLYFKFILVIVVCSVSTVTLADSVTQKADINNKDQVKRGKMLYLRFCSLCHGKNLEGQSNWRIRKSDGKLPAPPHDETGHTWHHTDNILFNITKHGLVPPNAPDGYKSEMPAWKDTLSDSDIWTVLAYIKSRWPKETQDYQQALNNAK